VGSRFVRRGTETAPTKSGVIGLVAAAKGIRRTEPIEELLSLRLGVRIDQPGQLIRDFQTAQRPEKARDGSTTWKSLPLSYRYYMADATYLVVLEGDRSLVDGIDTAVRSPAFPLYLGRRSCPPAGPVALGVSEIDLDQALNTLPWLATDRHQRSRRERSVRLETMRDAHAGEVGAETFRDEPVSFDPEHRRYAWRAVVRGAVAVDNPHGVEAALDHDPMSPLGG
jgi:CRISPR system Cascade subunit CasD